MTTASLKTKVIQKRITEINPYFNNPRIHSEVQIKKIANAIFNYGFLSVIVIDKAGSIIAGHGRYHNLKSFGHKKALRGL